MQADVVQHPYWQLLSESGMWQGAWLVSGERHHNEEIQKEGWRLQGEEEVISGKKGGRGKLEKLALFMDLEQTELADIKNSDVMNTILFYIAAMAKSRTFTYLVFLNILILFS